MTLNELAVACYIYNIIANEDSYVSFRATIKNSPNLCKQEHRDALLEFLNKFGCRHIAKGFHEMASNKIQYWYKKYCKKLPQKTEKLWELNYVKLKSFDELHSTLSKLVVTNRKGRDREEVHMGSVGAAKMLFAIRPHVFPPWDNAIQKELRGNDSVKSYVDYLKHVQKDISGLKETCKVHKIDLDELPEKLGRSKSTVVKLIDEYYWITITKKFTKEFNLEEIVQRWNKWAKSSRKRRKQK